MVIKKEKQEERVIRPEESQEEVVIENKLRPQSLREYIGQKAVKGNLEIFLQAAKGRGEALEHTLLYGAPGIGKTTLAHVIANELGVGLKVTSGPLLDKPGDMAAILTNLEPGTVLFIDEIHRLRSVVEEVLYTAMEDFVLDIILGKGPAAKSVRIDLPKFTLVGATTKVSLLTAPLRDRFGTVFRLDYYEEDELAQIIERSAGILGVGVAEEARNLIAKRARFTPRIANRLLKRVRDYAEVKHEGEVNVGIAEEALEKLGVDELGLDQTDRELLEILVDKFAGRPVGLKTLAAALGGDEGTIEDVYEPYLIRLGFLERTARGRCATKRAMDYLGCSLEKGDQQMDFWQEG